MKTALITGITGQDGSYLAELLLDKGYEVHGIIRRASNFNTQRLEHIFGDLQLHYGDLADSSSLNRILEKSQPTEIYNLGAQSHVQVSFETPEYTADTDAIGVLRFLDAIKDGRYNCKFYQASTSELYGLVQETPQRETTPFYPRSPYAVAKLYAYWIALNYREAYGLYTSNGILFNHESERRGKTFVTRKITQAVVAIHEGKQECLHLGNIDAKRDWGYAKDYVLGMWQMMQLDKGDDFVLATGETHTVREFCEKAFAYVGVPIAWQGHGVHEVGINTKTGKTVIAIDPAYFRPTEVDLLLGDATKAFNTFGWKATTTFEQLVNIMMEADLTHTGM